LALSILDVLKNHRVDYAEAGHHHVRDGWLGVDCPKCSPGTRKYRLGFNLSSWACTCWVCGKQRSWDMLAMLCRISRAEAASLWRSGGKVLPTARKSHSGALALPQAGALLPVHQQYLRKRGFDPAEMERVWKIKGIGPMHPVIPWSILIPIHDDNGRCVSWTSRAISEDVGQRYHAAAPEQEDIPHKEIIYGAEHLTNTIIVVEGPISAWGIGPGGGATLGLGYTDDQLALIAMYPVRAVCFDATPEAQRRAEKLCRDLAPMPGTTDNILLETGKDPAECSKYEISEIRKQYELK